MKTGLQKANERIQDIFSHTNKAPEMAVMADLNTFEQELVKAAYISGYRDGLGKAMVIIRQEIKEVTDGQA